MNAKEIKDLRKKIGTDPILTDEEIEYIWMAMDKQEVERQILEKFQDDSKWVKCPGCGQVWQNYCHYCGRSLKWQGEE